MLTGSCLCGEIQYRVDGTLGPLVHCHCRTCQKAHAAAFATTARTSRESFSWTKGAERVAYFESTPGKRRYFCSRCGSHLMAEWTNKPHVIVRVASLDTKFESSAVAHIWTSHQASWFEMTDSLPRFSEGR